LARMVLGRRHHAGITYCGARRRAGLLLASRLLDGRNTDPGGTARPPKCEPATRSGMKNVDLELDDAVLSRPRLSILAALLGNDAVDFTFLSKNLGISDGNLGTHLQKLEAAGYIRSKKAFVNRKPKT